MTSSVAPLEQATLEPRKLELKLTPENIKKAGEDCLFPGHMQAINDLATELFAEFNNEDNEYLDILDDKTGLLKSDITLDDLITLASIDEINAGFNNEPARLTYSPPSAVTDGHHVFDYDADGNGYLDRCFRFDNEDGKIIYQIMYGNGTGTQIDITRGDDNYNISPGISIWHYYTSSDNTEEHLHILERALPDGVSLEYNNKEYSIYWKEDGSAMMTRQE